MPPLVPNTIGYLLDLDGPRGDIIKRVTNLQLHRGIGDSLWGLGERSGRSSSKCSHLPFAIAISGNFLFVHE